jgi:alpha-tubulin suppressor-like RCC1 family protein
MPSRLWGTENVTRGETVTDTSAEQETTITPTRRTVVAAGLWSVPAITLVSSAPAFAGSATRAITVSSPGNTAVASGVTSLTTSVKTTAGVPLSGEAVSLTGPGRSTFAAANGTTNGSGLYTTSFNVNRAWARPGSTATVTALAGGESGSAALAVLGANAYRVGTGGGRPNVSGPTQEDLVFPSPITAFSMGMDNVAALLADGTVWTTGANSTLIGDGSPGRGTWGKVPSLSGITNVCLSNLHAGAVTSAGELYMWGGNGYGQLGFGNTTALNTPTKVPGMTGVKQVSTGRMVTFVLKNDGSVWAAGWNANFQLGKTGGDSSTFVQIAGLSSVSQISGGFLMGGLALKNDGTVWAWGNNGAGQLCDGTTTDSATPKQIPGLTNVKKVQGGSGSGYGASSGYALKTDNTLWAWGVNEDGQLGDGTTANRTTPIKFGDNYADVAASTQVVYAIKTDGVTLAASGRTKIDALRDVTTPATITLPHPVVAMSEQTYAAYDNQRTYLITAETSVSVDVVQTQISAGTAGTVKVTVSAGSAGVASTSVGLTATVGTLATASGTTSASGTFQTTITPGVWTSPGTVGRVTADTDANTGSDTFTVLGANLLHDNGTSVAQVPTQFASPVVRAQTGAGREWILLEDGTVWARNGGDGTFTQVAGITDGVDLTASSAQGGSYWVLKKDGTVWGWGDNADGQLGDGTTTNQWNNAVQFSGLTGVTKIAAANGTLFAVRSDKTLWAAGANVSGKAGIGSTSTPVPLTQVAGGTDVIDVAGRRRGGTLVKADGTVWSWGEGAEGAVGDGQTTDRLSPVQITTLSNVASVTSGITNIDWYAWTMFAITKTGAVYAWGSNATGAYGNNTTTNSTTPVQITGLTGVTQIAVSNNAVVALRSDGTMLKWGGRASTPTKYTPARPVARLSNANAGAYNDRIFLITK